MAKTKIKQWLISVWQRCVRTQARYDIAQDPCKAMTSDGQRTCKVRKYEPFSVDNVFRKKTKRIYMYL